MTRHLLFAIALVFAARGAGFAQTVTLPPSGDNQRSLVTQQIGLVKVSVEYSSPDVHGPNGEDRRGKIWGALVPYGIYDLAVQQPQGALARRRQREHGLHGVPHRQDRWQAARRRPLRPAHDCRTGATGR